MNKENPKINETDMSLQTGQMPSKINGVELIKDMLEVRVYEKIQKFLDKITVWDVDGTLCKFKSTPTESKRLLPCNDADLKIYLNKQVKYNEYDYAQPLLLMQYLLSRLASDLTYTLSTTSILSVRPQKTSWLKENFPTIKEEHMYYSSNDDEKLKYLKKISQENSEKEVVFIDDTTRTLLKVEEKYPQIQVQHISNFLI